MDKENASVLYVKSALVFTYSHSSLNSIKVLTEFPPIRTYNGIFFFFSLMLLFFKSRTWYVRSTIAKTYTCNFFIELSPGKGYIQRSITLNSFEQRTLRLHFKA